MTMDMPSKTQQAPILSVEDLCVNFEGSRGTARILEGIDFTLYPGEVLALVGETGCGKSVTAKSLLDLIPQLSRQRTGRVFFEGNDLLKRSSRELGRVRGRSIAMIFQNPQSSINPVFTLGEQMFRLIRMYLADEIDALCKQEKLKERAAVHKISAGKTGRSGVDGNRPPAEVLCTRDKRWHGPAL